MPRWIGRLLYAMRGRRRVRIHMERGWMVGPADEVDVQDLTIEGILLGRWCGHYVLQLPQLVESEDATVRLEGEVEIPAERVLFVQVIGRGR